MSTSPTEQSATPEVFDAIEARNGSSRPPAHAGSRESRRRKGHPPRLRGWNYAAAGYYFVTFNVGGRARCLSRVEEGKLRLSRWGALVDSCWRELPARFPNAALDACVIMPDHVHAVVVLMGGEVRLPPGSGAAFQPLMADPRPLLGKVVRAWKAKSTRLIRQGGLADFRWQSRFYDRIIRDEAALTAVRNYIRSNPNRWRG